MCGGLGPSNSNSNSNSSAAQGTEAVQSNSMKDTSKLSVETEDSFSSLLEFAANNDVESFKRSIEFDLSAVDEAGPWFVRREGSRQISEEERTPLMVAATYGCVDVLKLIVALPEVDLNRSCGSNKWTALHCATSGGSIHALDIVTLLLSAGADPNVEDISGRRAVDMITVPPRLPGVRAAIEELLMNNISDGSVGEGNLHVSICSSNASSPVLSSPQGSRSPSSVSDSVSLSALKLIDVTTNSTSDKKQYPVDPSLPDIRNSIYSTDEFRMFSFKVRPCSRAYSHDWTECPFVHPGENARRRDPLKIHYSCVPCPDFRKGGCRRGDLCEYAHGVFECWLHPAQYRTRLCKDGTSCARQVCFFAHTQDELRPMYASTGSGVPSPRSAAAAASFMDMAAALSLLPGSPSSHSIMSPAFDQSMSPAANGLPHSTGGWPQPNVSTLHLPGCNLQSSRLRSSINARDIPPEDHNMLQDVDTQQLTMNEFSCFSQSRPNSSVLSRSGRSNSSLAPSNLEELFMAEIASSPRFSDQAFASGVFSPNHKSAILNQFQQQQGVLSPINTNQFSSRNIEHPLLQASLGVSSPRMSPRSLESLSPMSARLPSYAYREKQQQQQMPSLSSRDFGSNQASSFGSPAAAWSNWGSPIRKTDWSVTGEGRALLERSTSFELNGNGDEPDLSWVQSLVKESPPEMMGKPVSSDPGALTSSDRLETGQTEPTDHSVLGAWLEQMQLDQLVV